MKYCEKTARAIVEKHGLSPTTLRVWKLRGKIPDRYSETEERVILSDVLPDTPINVAIEKYGIELQRLLGNRKFRPNQNNGYYRSCLYSLCKECEQRSK